MKIIIALCLLSVAAALPRPGTVPGVVEISPQTPEIKKDLEGVAERVKVVDAVEDLQNIEVEPLDVAKDIVRVVNNAEVPVVVNLPVVSESLVPLILPKASIPASSDINTDPESPVETVQIIDKAVDQQNEAVESVDTADDVIGDAVRVVNNVDEPLMIDLSMVPDVDDEGVEPIMPINYVLPAADKVRVVDNVDTVRVVDSLESSPVLPSLDRVRIVNSPEDFLRSQVTVVSTPIIVEAIHNFVEKVKVVDSPLMFQPPKIYKYQHPMLR